MSKSGAIQSTSSSRKGAYEREVKLPSNLVHIPAPNHHRHPYCKPSIKPTVHPKISSAARMDLPIHSKKPSIPKPI